MEGTLLVNIAREAFLAFFFERINTGILAPIIAIPEYNKPSPRMLSLPMSFQRLFEAIASPVMDAAAQHLIKPTLLF